MPLALQLPFALSSTEYGMLVSLLIPVAAIILAGVITVSALYFKHQRRRLWHETARLALEKGQPVPPMTDFPRYERDSTHDHTDLAQHDVRGGMVLIGVGCGLWLMLGAIHDPLRYVGAIPGFIGIALLTYALGRALFGPKAKRDNVPPRT